MTIHLRQICLVARKLEPVIDDLTEILGINRCYVDPGVGKFGLENTLMPIGRNFLEVVAPIEGGTAGGRYLDRRGGDGGYMVITQADSRKSQDEIRQNALDNGVRVAYESERNDWFLCQLHPGDLKAAFFEIESDAQNDFYGYWHPVGGLGWEEKVKQDVTVDFRGVELQGSDPLELGELWAKVAGVELQQRGDHFAFELNNATLRFVEAKDGRGPGLSGIDLVVADREHILKKAKERSALVSEDQVDIGGVHWHLHEA